MRCLASRSATWVTAVERFLHLLGYRVVLLGVLTACVPPEADIDGGYKRIVSLAPSTTELLFAIGAGELVVGRTQWDADPPAALAVPSVGQGLDPNVEAVAARRPDLVILYDSPANATVQEHLERLGIATIQFSMDRLDDVARGARLLGRLTDTERRADSLADVFAAALDSARRVPVPEPRPTVLILSWDQPPIVIGGGSFQSELLELAGAVNAFADLSQPSAQVSIETVAARNPDLILLTGDTSDLAWARRPEWRVVPAVRDRRFAVVSGTQFSYPSFRSLAAVRELRDAMQRAGR